MKPIFHKLANGASVIFAPQKGTASMTILVLMKVGSRYETKETNGASHFLEHLMFKGTKRRPSTEVLTRILDQYGAEYNAFTSKDVTGYYVKIDASHGPLAIDILQDMLRHSLFDAKEIDRERGVIIEEINMYEDNPRMHLDDLLDEALYPSSTLGWNIAGPRSVIREISREQLIAHRERYYIPSRMTIAVSGNIPSTTLRDIQKTFGAIRTPRTKNDDAFDPFLVPEKLQKPLRYQEKKTEQVQVGIAFHGLSIRDARLPAASLLATILGGSMSSRLFLEIRERRGLCYSIRASHEALEDTGAFTISAGLKKDRLQEAMREIYRQIRRMMTEPVTSAELQRAKDHLRGRTALAFEDSEVQADWYARQWMFQGSLLTPEQKMRQIEKVGPHDLKMLASQIFRKETMAQAVIVPVGSSSQVARVMRWI